LGENARTCNALTAGGRFGVQGGRNEWLLAAAVP